MSTINNQKLAARQFVQEWSGRGYEKGETQRFWMALLHNSTAEFLIFQLDDREDGVNCYTPTKRSGSPRMPSPCFLTSDAGLIQ